jgi:hypothetical protein
MIIPDGDDDVRYSNLLTMHDAVHMTPCSSKSAANLLSSSLPDIEKTELLHVPFMQVDSMSAPAVR